MKIGKLVYDESSGRIALQPDDGGDCIGLHCGQVIEVLCPCCKEWRAGRVECIADRWCLAELGDLGKDLLGYYIFKGLPVRMET